MSFSNGTFSINSTGQPVVTGTVISSTAFNALTADLATGLSTCVLKDGTQSITANIPMSAYRHTGVGDATARDNYASAGQVQDGSFVWCGTAGGTANALTFTPSPAITAYTAGQEFIFKSGVSPNSSATTIAISGLATKAVQANGSALAGGEIAASQWYKILYDGTAFQLSFYTGIVPVANGGTGAITASAARTALGLAIGTDIQAYDADTAKLDVSQVWTAGQRGAVTALTDGATITPDFSLGNNFAVAPSLGGNRTLANPSNPVAGQSGVIYFPQDDTGSRTLAFGWGWPSSGFTLSTAIRTIDALAYYVAVYATSTVTITIATPGVVTWTAHGLMNGQKIQLTTTGALPTGLSASTTYYVKWVDANSFQLSATKTGAAINTSVSQSGTHTCTAISIQASLAKDVL